MKESEGFQPSELQSGILPLSTCALAASHRRLIQPFREPNAAADVALYNFFKELHMVRQIPGEVAEKLLEQAKDTGRQAKKAPSVVFKRMLGERTEEEKKADKDSEEQGLEDQVSGSGLQAGQPALNQADMRRREIEAEKKAKLKKMRKLLHKKVFEDAKRARELKEEKERLKKMEKEEERKGKEEKKIEVFEQQKKEEALAVKIAKRPKGAGEFGPKKPK